MSTNLKITNEVKSIIFSLCGGEKDLDGDAPLIGDGSVLDSMKLVELCIALEDLASEYGFAFDWTSSTALSKSRSMFRNLDSLVTEFEKQQSAKS